jgi:soluble lytic murein transglycosylase-like protein
MKLYQRFLYSALLISVFLLYADNKNIEISEQKAISVIIQYELSKSVAQEKISQLEINRLNEKIGSMSIQEKQQTEIMISNYITSNFRRTPMSVAKEISRNVIEVSEQKKIAAPLLLGIIEVESNFNPFALSKAGARGLMQVMPEWVGKLDTPLKGKYDLHDIQTGISAGADVFKIHLAENDGNVNKGLYYYVNKDNSYVLKVYTAIGKYLAYSKAE